MALAGLQLAGCVPKSAEVGHHQDDDDDEPARVEQVAETDISRVILTPRAAQRLDIRTAPALEAQLTPSGMRKVVPYASVLYDSHGDTWVYTNPEPQVFVRHPIAVDYIEGDRAVLSDGPPSGTEVVTVGAAELFGTEFEIGH